ncbi:hypothetical protein Moror_5037 [Moniliophthora roreri MCA 2997]|uniref:Uncharacterized protein n=2 Tax=Moniliophthora roreri TaxID=221103 RepID=V2X1K4_MONRO|nr:hypothetical protein Moror_5037 [Moniliophthora roreri MCA 2997]
MSLSPVWRQYDASFEPVNQRVWCPGERLLSPRSLVFVRHIYSSVIVELPHFSFFRNQKFPSPYPSTTGGLYVGLGRTSSVTILNELLTKPNDKLIAFAAVAVDGHVIAFTMDGRSDMECGEVGTCEISSVGITLATTLVPFEKVGLGTLTLRAVKQKAAWNPHATIPDLYLQQEFALGCLDELSSHPSEVQHIGITYPDDTEGPQEVWVSPIQWNRRERYAAGLIVARVVGGQDCRVRHFHSPEGTLDGLNWINQAKEKDIIVRVRPLTLITLGYIA